MRPDYEMLSHLSLFSGIHTDNLQAMLQCIGGRFQTLHKGEFPILARDEVPYVDIILKCNTAGQDHIVHRRVSVVR